jgi:hypothetical protein
MKVHVVNEQRNKAMVHYSCIAIQRRQTRKKAGRCAVNSLTPAVKKSRVIKLRMRWVGYVARMGKRTGVYRVLVGKPKEKRHLEEAGVDRIIILK